MREILFRGKDDCEWLYGSLVHQTDYYGMPVNKCYILDGTDTEDYIGPAYEVNPETVGQCTGLQDKSGKKIFEGDIVEGTIHSAWAHHKIRCEVAWSKYGFECREYVNSSMTKYAAHSLNFGKDIVVIGNIYDNPELLKEG